MGIFDSLKSVSGKVQSIVKSGSDTVKTVRHTASDLVTDAGNAARNVGYYAQNFGSVITNIGSGVRRVGNQANGTAAVLKNDALFKAAEIVGDQTTFTGNANVRPSGNTDGTDWFVIAAWGVGAVATYALLKKM
ncbi:MAG: hypothetical protein QE263_04620 [Vampirovibrionales bacterium]|nr:hypothetical protein [Vampirovibrionales bacterium]